MSRGPGRLQREIAAIFDAEPEARITIAELARRIYGTETTARWQRQTIARTLRYSRQALGLTSCRIAGTSQHLGWQLIWGKLEMRAPVKLLASETRQVATTELADATEVRFAPVAEDGNLEGWATRFNTPDAYRTSFDPAAFQWRGERLPLLWAHDPGQIIGSIRNVTAEPEGLKITAKLNLEVQRAREARAMLIEGDVSGLSIGFRRIRDEVRQGGIPHITQAQLVEVSLVAVPAVPGSRVTSTRTLPPAQDLTAFLAACTATTAVLKGN